MKTLLLSLAFILVAGIATAQEPGTPPPMPPHPNCPHMKKSCITDKKHEIGIGVVNLMQWPRNIYPLYPYMDMLWFPYYPYYSQEPSLGLTYRYHNASGAYRIGVEFAYEENSSRFGYGESEYSDLRSGISSGYEWHNNFRKLQLFYGLDLAVKYSLEKSSNEDTSGNRYSSEETTLGYGINPLVGLRFYLTPNISLSSETQFRFAYTDNDYSNKSNGVQYSNNSKSFKVGFAPLGLLSLGIHF